jgi:hypothetical protein
LIRSASCPLTLAVCFLLCPLVSFELDRSVNQQSRELLSCVKGFFTNISKAVNAPVQEEAVLRFNDAVNAMQAYIRVARLTSKASVEDLIIS